MRSVSARIFDDIITGAGPFWYSSAQMNELLGSADSFAIQACTTFVSGTTPTLTVTAQHSADAQNWFDIAAPEISAVAIANEGAYWGWRGGFVPAHMAYVRFKISLGGTSPVCRLELYFTGRTRGGTAPNGAMG